jgi:hypothetical protein
MAHFIRDGRFVCTAEPSAPCRNYPGCECEEWSEELHGEVPVEGHADKQQEECWMEPWLHAVPLCDTYATEGSVLDDEEFPDGPVLVDWQHDWLVWEYANEDVRPA